MITDSKRSHDLSNFMAGTMLVLVMLACTIPSQPNNQGQGTPKPIRPGNAVQEANLAKIIPGTTTQDEVVALLGEPLAVEPESDHETLLYASPLPGQFDSIVVRNLVVALVSIVLGDVNPLAWSAVQAQYGEPAHTTYSNYLDGSMTYIYPDQGLAFVASQESDVVFIRECFVPMALEEYMSTWGSSLPTEDPFNR